MKKIFLLLGLSVMIFSCQPEESISTEDNQVIIDLVQIQNDLQLTPNAIFNSERIGLYKGVFASNDMEYHGVLSINVNNNGSYNALLKTTDNQLFGFIADNRITKNHRVILFQGNDGSFELDITDIDNPLISNAIFKDRISQGKVLKETSENRVMVSLGTYIDDNDASFNGTWDLISNNTEVLEIPTGLVFPSTISVTVNIVSEVVLITSNGGMFSDSMMESFTAGINCGNNLPPGTQAPFFTGPQVVFGQMINEYAMSSQSSTYLGEVSNWTFNYSLFQGDIYYDADCNVIPAGTWSWNGRTGSILLD